jgi:protein tyrosine phosphatase
MKKRALVYVLLSISIIAGLKYVYDIHLNYNFKEISKDKVYKSGVIPPEKLAKYVKEFELKSVIDLRFPGTNDLVNNPETPKELLDEKEALSKLPGVNYFNLGSPQVPEKATVDRFLNIMDDQSNYPVLIHCYHGDGRAQLFSALYRIEYEGFSNTGARKKTRFIVKGSSFDVDKPKGIYLENYQLTRR